MEWKRVLIVAGGTCGFLAVVAAGALAIVSLAPGERPAAGEENALLMESTPALRPFDEPARPPAPSPAPTDRTALAERPAIRTLPIVRPPLQRPSPEAVDSERTGEPEPARVAPPPQRVPPSPALAPARPEPRALAALAPPLAPSHLAPPPVPRPPERRVDGVLTPAEIRRLRLSLRLTPEQAPYWVPVEQALQEIGTQQAAMVRAGQDPKDAFGVGAAMRMYSVARPLLGVLREDQKAQVRERAKAMGFGNVASQI